MSFKLWVHFISYSVQCLAGLFQISLFPSKCCWLVTELPVEVWFVRIFCLHLLKGHQTGKSNLLSGLKGFGGLICLLGSLGLRLLFHSSISISLRAFRDEELCFFLPEERLESLFLPLGLPGIVPVYKEHVFL